MRRYFILGMILTAAAAYGEPGGSPSPSAVFAYSDIESFPYQMGRGEKVADPPGIAVELISQAAEAAGVRLRFIRVPNKRVLYDLKEDKVDGIFSFSFSPERAAFGRYPMRNGKADSSRRIMTASYYLYKMTGSPIDWDGKAFTGIQGKVGINRGYSIINELEGMNIPFEEATDTKQNIKKLLLGRIVGYIGQNLTTDRIIKEHPEKFKNVEKVPIPVATKDYYLVLSDQFVRQHSRAAEKLWIEIGERRDAETSRLIGKYSEPSE